MPRHPVIIEDGDTAPGQAPDPLTEMVDRPPPEDILGGDDIYPIEPEPSTEIDKPLD